MLDLPLHDGFFPPVVLSTQEVSFYRRLGRSRAAQLARIIEDAECAYKWTPCRPQPSAASSAGGSAAGGRRPQPVVAQRAQFLDLQPSSKATRASTLLKASAQMADASADEVLTALAKLQTRDLRKMMGYVHGPAFVDARTLFTLPSTHKKDKPYAYRAIKWTALRGPSASSGGGHNGHKQQMVDFCYLEYAGARRSPRPGSSVVGFIVQESIARPREVPSLSRFGISRGSLSRVGIFVSRVAHQPATCRVTALCQLDEVDAGGSVEAGLLAAVMQRYITDTVGRLAGLIERQRVSRLRFVEQWQWIPNAERKACAVCLRGFYFHRKHHCRTCGEVVCSSCAPLRELEEPIFDISHLRVCSVCMLAAANPGTTAVTTDGRAESSNGFASTSTGDDEETYARALRSPRHDSYEDMIFHLRGKRDRERDRERKSDAERKSDVVAPLRPQDKMQVLTNVVSRIRDIRDTIDMTISEADGRGEDDFHHPADDDDDNDSHDLYSEMQSIRDALETSVSHFDAALVTATAKGQDENEPGNKRQGRGGSDGDDEMTPDQFTSVARITLAAARATKQAGEAFLSCSDVGRQQQQQQLQQENKGRRGHRHHLDGRHRDNQRPHHRHRREAKDLLIELGSGDTDEGDNSEESSHGHDDSEAGSQDPYADGNYEKLMKTSFGSETDEERSRKRSIRDRRNEGGDGALTDTSAGNSSSGSSSRRTSREIKQMMTGTKTAKIRDLEQQIRDLQRCLDEAQRKLSVMESDDFTPLDLNKQRQRQQKKPVAVKQSRESIVAAADSLVSELRSVMNSTEVTNANKNGRRSISKKPTPRKPPTPQEPFANVSTLPSPIAVVLEDQAFDTPPQGRQRKLDLSGDSFDEPRRYSHPIEKRVKSAPSSSGSNVTTGKTDVRSSEPPQPAAGPVDPLALGISDSGEWDDLSDSESDGDDVDDSHSYSSAEPQREHSGDHRDSRVDKLKANGTVFEEEDLHALLRQRTSLVTAAAADRHSLLGGEGAPRRARNIEDESDELRGLMAALARPRSNSTPANQHGGAPSQEGTALNNATAATAEGEAPLQPSWSDGSPERGPTAHHVDHAVQAIRACLASLRCECPSTNERRRRIAGVAHILNSLRRDGVRSQFRTLPHEELGYAQVLQRAPSVVKLLKLAGYVSLPQKLTMRRVDSSFLLLVLRELDRELDA